MSNAFQLRCVLVFGLIVPVCGFAQHANAQGSGNLSPVAPFHMPQSIGPSPQSIGLSPSSIALSPHSIPVSKPARSEHSPAYSSGHHRDRTTAGAFIAAPLFLPEVNDFVPVDTAQAETPANETAALSDQLKQLSQQLRDLQDQLARSSATPEQSVSEQEPAAPPAAPPITIVLKSGQSFQTQNYAVIGGTFWDLSSEPTRKLPVSTIDTAASQRATEANGVEFPTIP